MLDFANLGRIADLPLHFSLPFWAPCVRCGTTKPGVYIGTPSGYACTVCAGHVCSDCDK